MELEAVKRVLQFLKGILLEHHIVVEIVSASALDAEDFPSAANFFDEQQIEHLDLAQMAIMCA